MITVATKKQGASLTETSLTKNLKKQTSTKQTHCTAIPFLNRPATTPRTNGEDDDKAKAVTATKGIKSPEAAVAWETIKEIAVAGNANDKASFPKRKVSLSPEPSDGNKDRSPYKNDHPSRRADVSGIGAQDAPQHGSHSRSLKKPINYYKEDSSDDGSIFSLSSSSQRITDNNVLIVDDRKPTAVPTPPTKTNRVKRMTMRTRSRTRSRTVMTTTVPTIVCPVEHLGPYMKVTESFAVLGKVAASHTRSKRV